MSRLRRSTFEIEGPLIASVEAAPVLGGQKPLQSIMAGYKLTLLQLKKFMDPQFQKLNVSAKSCHLPRILTWQICGNLSIHVLKTTARMTPAPQLSSGPHLMKNQTFETWISAPPPAS